MTTPPPAIDERTEADVALQLQGLIRQYAAPSDATPDWQPGGFGSALIAIASRFAGIVIQRLNQVPQKNLLAYLDLLGSSLLPPQPARVPLTFLPASGMLMGAAVPAGTQASAPPPPGDSDPVVFETENDLVVTAAQLVSLVVHDPEQDRYSDSSSAITSPPPAGVSLFRGAHNIDHIFYIAHSQLLALPGLNRLTVTLTLQSLPADVCHLQWEFWDGTQWQARTALASSFSQSFQDFALDNPPACALAAVNGMENRWVRCRLLEPVTPSANAQIGMVRANQLPKVLAVRLQAHLAGNNLSADAALTNQSSVDLTKDFFPFGDRPVFNDTLYISQGQAFATPGASVTLNVQMTAGFTVVASPDLKLAWEVWNGSQWFTLGATTPAGPVTPVANGFSDATKAFTANGAVTFTLPFALAATEVAGTAGSWVRVRIIAGNYGVESHYTTASSPATGFVVVPDNFQPPVINSLLVSYTADVQDQLPENIATYNNLAYQTYTPGQSFYPFTPPAETCPSAYFGLTPPLDGMPFPNDAINIFLRTEDFKFGQVIVPLSPENSRQAGPAGGSAVHTFIISNPLLADTVFNVRVVGGQWTSGILQASINAIPLPTSVQIKVATGTTQQISVQVSVPAGSGVSAGDRAFLQVESSDGSLGASSVLATFCGAQAPDAQPPQVVAEYWNGGAWIQFPIEDGTSGFVRSGVVSFLAPPDFTLLGQFGLPLRYWIRARWAGGDYAIAPHLQRATLNTVMASQAQTFRDETLGSSDGSAGQAFQIMNAPVLPGQKIEVCEPEMPPARERNVIFQAEGPDAITETPVPAGQPKEVWVRWHEVPDFYGSGPRDRHYTLDHSAGKVLFGDGTSGLIPPLGSGNLRISLYRSGGGVRGNVVAGSVAQLMSTVPYIDSVANQQEAAGGADAETTDALIGRAAKVVRHRQRAVTAEDYEDLARQSSTAVARVMCVPARNLAANPCQSMHTPGYVTVIVASQSSDPNPQPSLQLLEQVQQYLAQYAPVDVAVRVMGPMYVRVDVTVQIGVASLDSTGILVRQVQASLAAFLHPLTGGLQHQGWQFGREPHESDIYAVIGAVPGVDHIRSFSLNQVEDVPGIRDTGWFLVYSGRHNVTLFYEPG